jgi:hypothetical protein
MNKFVANILSTFDNQKFRNMISKRKVKIYIVKPIGFKTMSINVKEFETGYFNCYFLDSNVINEFKTEGFKLSYYEGVANFIFNGNLNVDIVSAIWQSIEEKIDYPDIEFMVKNLNE